MVKKGSNNKSNKKRSIQKVLDAYQIAERQENRNKNKNIDNESEDETNLSKGILDARKFLSEDSRKEDLLDEELDSDEALGSDDEYDILNSRFSQSIRDRIKKQKIGQKIGQNSVSEEDEEGGYSSIDENQLVTLSEAWDLDDKDLQETLKQNPKAKQNNELVLNDGWITESSVADSSTGDDETTDSSDASSDEDDIFQTTNNEEFNLTKTLNRLNSSIASKKPKEKKKLINESRQENEFNLPTNGQHLSIQEMMQGVEGEEDNPILIDQSSKSIATPLPQRIQQRNDRGIAYDLAKKEISKWTDTIQQNRQAEVLKFPMQQIEKPPTTATTFRLENQPETELETKVNHILSQSALIDDKKESTFEEIEMAKLTPQELKKRTNELRLMRELMFREEKRNKRLRKIKSKTYHKIKKRERERNKELVETDEEEEEDQDMKRAKERMSLKHKTQSKWAQSMIKSGLSKDASNRSELEEMLRQGEKLREKQINYDIDHSDENVSEIEKEYENELEQDRSKLGKGIMNMKFMKNAEAKKKEENLSYIQELKNFKENSDVEDNEENNNLINLTKNQGRRVYNPTASPELEGDDERQKKNNLEVREEVREIEETNEIPKQIDEENPWLISTSDSKQKSNKITTIEKDSSTLAKSAAKIAKLKARKGMSNESLIHFENSMVFQNEEDEDEEAPQMFKQKDLIKQAFAGDDVVAEFENEKKRVIEDEDDKEEDVTLPGWGDWAGGSLRKNNKKRKFIRKVDGVMQKEKRKDKNLKNVIINEKINKKNLQYQSSDVPYPFETREQYERSLRMPIGQEWTSRETHQKLTMPRIITKQGMVIDPLKAPFK
ncbi:unnamed protein product [Candida verbasci]|uniref:U3 small nucleolar RNA-associated protein 14 n=1 Tax=Candida verbasci TaxID=1227364 RepID=A0A9W4XJN0_9ASCO|nr:unnamed protein product [Candida verbasci]